MAFDKMMVPDEINHIERWKEPGRMTQVSQEIQDLADSIDGEGVVYLKNVCRYLREYYYTPDFSKRPNRMKRTAHDILFPPNDIERDEQGRPPIGTCTEHGKAIRALAIAKGIPTVWIETLEEGWINGKYPEGMYSGHIFLEVFINGKWWILNTTGNPQNSETFIREEKGAPVYLSRKSDKIAGYRVIATGLDSRSLQATDGTQLSFSTEEEWVDYVDNRFSRKDKE